MQLDFPLEYESRSMRLPHNDRDAALAPQRVDAEGRLAVASRGGQTRLLRLGQEGAAKIRLPRVPKGAPLEAVLINTAGGLTGGDRLAWAVDLAADARAVVTTQACEKIYRSAGGLAEVSSRLRLGPAARLAWLPQEAIVFDGARLARRLDVELAEGAEVLVLEAVVFGRAAMGEQVVTAEISDRWEVRRDGRLIHAEAFSIGPAVQATLERSAVAAGAGAVACLLLVADQAPQCLAAVRALIGASGGASAWTVGRTGKLLARVIARDSYGLRQRLVPLLELLNGEAALPKVWSI